MRFNLEDIVRITAGRLKSKGAGNGAVITGISHDTRTLKPGMLFVAIKGETHDGHVFVDEAVQRGASAVLVSRRLRGLPEGVPVITVKDTLKAFGALGRACRCAFKGPVIAVTGSAGKTTTKDLIAAVLSQRFRVLKNAVSHNNQIGVPQTLFQLDDRVEILVVELGTNQPGDIRELSDIVRPTAAVITNIGASHLERLGSPRKVLEEKAEVVRSLPAGSTVIYNGDDPLLRSLVKRGFKREWISYGFDPDCDIRAGGMEAGRPGLSLSWKVNRRHPMFLKSPVRANVLNALAAISCGRRFNISYNNIYQALAGFRFTGNRQVVKKANGLTVINDCYNANPVSFESALETLGAIPAPGRRILVCGDMLELGAEARRYHRRTGRTAAQVPVDRILAYGPLAGELARSAVRTRPQTGINTYTCLKDLIRDLRRLCRRGDVILIKGSRAMRLERVVEDILNTRRRR